MNVDSVYIINRFAQRGTLEMQMTNVPDTLNVSVTNVDVYTESVSHIDSIVSQIGQVLTALSAETTTCDSIISELLTHWTIPVIIALIAMSAPLLLTNINGIDTKYHSTRILNAFQQTKEFTCIKYTILIIGIFTLIKIISWECAISSLLLIVCSLIFILSIALLCIRLSQFYNYGELAKYLINTYNKKTNKTEKDSFYYALIDCLKHAISQNDKHQTEKILKFFEQDLKNNKYYIPSQSCKDFITEITELICRDKSSQLLYQNADNKYLLPISFLFPDKQAMGIGVKISRESYQIIWDTILLYVLHDKDDYLLSYWDTAQNYYIYALTPDAKEEYIIFHEKIGAMLMANHKYDTLHDIIYWTESPNDENDIFAHFKVRLFTLQEKLISLNPETILLRYIRLMYEIDHDKQHIQIPHTSATEEMPNPIKEYAIRYMALLYLLTCQKRDEKVYFYYEDGEDLELSEAIDIATIQKQTNDLTNAAQKLLQSETLKKSFDRLGVLTGVPSLEHFVEAVDENFKLKTRISDILPQVYDNVDRTCLEEYKKAFKDYPLQEINDGRGWQKQKIGISWISFAVKEELNNVIISRPIYKEIENRIFCSIIDSATDVIDKLKINQQVNCSKEQLAEELSHIISQIPNRSDYVLICDDARGEEVLKNITEYQDSIYMGISVHFLPISAKGDICHFWLLKKEHMPSYKIEKYDDVHDIYGYQFKQINDDNEFYSQRIIMDIGRVTTEVYDKLVQNTPPNIKPQNRPLAEFVLVAGFIPVRWFTKKSSAVLCKFEVKGIPIDPRSYYYEEDDCESPEDIMTPFIITPDKHNKEKK